MKKQKILPILTAAILLTACGKTEDDGNIVLVPEPTVERIEINPEAENGAAKETASADAQGETPASDSGEDGQGTEPELDAVAAALKEKFGENCIAEQTFEVELSEYEGKVYFVPYAPLAGEGFHMQIVRNEEVLADIEGYVPDNLAWKPFESLDAVSFYDINYDGDTDIILIETYGGESFAAVYYGHSEGNYLFESAHFFPREELSEKLSASVEELSISGIRSFLSGGRRNGDFTDYKQAYEAVMKFRALEEEDSRYDLIYFDEDDTPELTAGVNGYYISMYTYADGTVYQLMGQWGYGAMGNSGYDYVPRGNSLRNYNTDYAGLILHTAYMRIGAQHSMETVVQIETYNFDDANGNGYPDEDEKDSVGKYGASYIDGKEVTPQECESYEGGEYQHMRTEKTMEEIKALLA